MRIVIGADHRGWRLKNHVKNYLKQLGHDVDDFGCFSKNPVDYPDIGIPVAEAVSRGDYERGILICGSANGISIAANKVKGIIAAQSLDENIAEKARQHLNANILTLASNLTPPKKAVRIVRKFLETEFEGGRHKRRIDKIFEYENKNS